MTEKLYEDQEFGIVVLRKNVRSRAISIRVKGVSRQVQALACPH